MMFLSGPGKIELVLWGYGQQYDSTVFLGRCVSVCACVCGGVEFQRLRLEKQFFENHNKTDYCYHVHYVLF